MEDISKKERKKLELERQREKSRQALAEHQEREEQFRLEKSKKKARKNKVIAVTAAILVVLIASGAYYLLSPGKYDDFAKCLTEKGAVMYGENWCPYTNAQKGMFGKSFKYIDYEVKTGLKIRPTWTIEGESYETVQSFERLSALTGCKI